MTTAQLETSTTATPLATMVVQPRPHVSTRATVEQTFSMAWRALMKMRRNPEQLIDVMVLPIVFTVMFTYVFGGAVSGSVGRYLPLIIPGILAQTVLTACVATGTQLREDMDKGVFDRFRSLPIARIAPLAGPMVADLVRYLIASTLTVLVGLVMGYRPGGGVFGVLAAVLLLVITGWSMAWVFTWVGTVMKSAQSVQGTSMMIMFPLTFLSNAFVPAGSMPGWLRAFVNVNPVSHVVTAARDLMNNGSVTPEVGWALLGCAAVIAIFAPLSVRSYRRKL